MERPRFKPTEKKWYQSKYWNLVASQFNPRIKKVLKKIDPKIPAPGIDAENGEGLYVYGSLGSGKTILACRALLEEQKRLYLEGNQTGGECLFVSIPELFHRIKNSYSDKYVGESEDEILQKYQQAHLLILDEFGMSKPSDWLLDILYLIINYRYEQMKPTIYTSNYDLEKVAEILEDKRITSRIERTCRIIKKKPWDD